MMKDRIFRCFRLSIAISIVASGMHHLVTSGETSLMNYCLVFWLAWFLWLFMKALDGFGTALARGDSLIQPSILEPLILSPISLIPVEIVGRSAKELSIEPIWVCVVIAGLIMLGAARLSEMFLARISDPLLDLIFRTSRKVVNRRYTQNIPVVCRSCLYCTAHTHLLCAIRPLGPEHPRYCQSFKARKNEQVL